MKRNTTKRSKLSLNTETLRSLELERTTGGAQPTLGCTFKCTQGGCGNTQANCSNNMGVCI